VPPSVALSQQRQQEKEFIMSKERENKTTVGRWFKELWGNPWNSNIVDQLGTRDMLLQYSPNRIRTGPEGRPPDRFIASGTSSGSQGYLDTITQGKNQ